MSRSYTFKTLHLVDPQQHPIATLFPRFQFSDKSVHAIRYSLYGKPVPLPVVDGVVVKEVVIPGHGASMVSYTYHPASIAPGAHLPTLFWLHGGGYVIGAPTMDHARLAALTKELGIVCVNVFYRLAPEYPYPAAIDDSLNALNWIHENADALNIDTNKIAVGGASAGAGLAASFALYVRDKTNYKFALQLLIYPMLDDRTCQRKHKPEVGEILWNINDNNYGWSSLLASERGGPRIGSDDVPPYAAAMRAKSLAGLPPALIAVGEYDLLRDECVAYAQRCWADGVSCELQVFPRSIHGFEHVPEAQVTKQLNQKVVYTLKRNLFE